MCCNTLNKIRQLANLDAPGLVGIGTFHNQASVLCFSKYHIKDLLTGKPLITHELNAETGEPVGDTYISTTLQASVFSKPSPIVGIEPARLPVSGILLAGLGCKPENIYGILHPEPTLPFDSNILDQIEFGNLINDIPNNKLSVKWI